MIEYLYVFGYTFIFIISLIYIQAWIREVRKGKKQSFLDNLIFIILLNIVIFGSIGLIIWIIIY